MKMRVDGGAVPAVERHPPPTTHAEKSSLSSSFRIHCVSRCSYLTDGRTFFFIILDLPNNLVVSTNPESNLGLVVPFRLTLF